MTRHDDLRIDFTPLLGRLEFSPHLPRTLLLAALQEAAREARRKILESWTGDPWIRFLHVEVSPPHQVVLVKEARWWCEQDDDLRRQADRIRDEVLPVAQAVLDRSVVRGRSFG
jgi:hypothetical protein